MSNQSPDKKERLHELLAEYGNACFACGEIPVGSGEFDELAGKAEEAKQAVVAFVCTSSAERAPDEGYPGIAHDFEKMRSALEYIAKLPDSYPASAIAARAREALPAPVSTERERDAIAEEGFARMVEGPNFNTEDNLHADTVAERHDARVNAEKARAWEWPCNTVGKLIANLQTLPPEMPFYTAYFVEIAGKRVTRCSNPSLSRETTDGFTVLKYDEKDQSLVIWASATPSHEALRTEAVQLADHLEAIARVSTLSKDACSICERAAQLLRGRA